MFRKIRITLLFAVLAGTGTLYAQQPAVEARIAGLEGNEEYMKLLHEDAQLQSREDSTVNAVEGLRQKLREDPASRQRFTQDILQLENRIFEIRNSKGRVIDRINRIEQNWVLANLNGEAQRTTAPAAENPVAVADSLKVRNLVDNLYFREHLAKEDYAALQRAQQMEMLAVDYVNRYFANYTAISDLAAAYEAAQTESEALDIYGRYSTLRNLNRVLADSLAQTWNYIFDNKSYAYGYLMDKLGKDRILTQEEERLAEAARQLATLRGETVSDELADYFLRKQVAVDYEMAVAGVLELDAARDSLKNIAAQLKTLDFRRPKVEVSERLFLDYDSLSFSVASPYNYKNPIPECRVYAKGTIYRILLGTFTSKRPVEVFRGTYPLCYRINDEGKWCYYAGGFATLAEAEKAQKQLKARGFTRPEIVVWTDGEYRNITREPDDRSISYRVEITGTEALSEAVKNAILQTAEGVEFSRVGQQMFVVGTFADKAVADRVEAAVRQADPALEIKTAEISE